MLVLDVPNLKSKHNIESKMISIRNQINLRNERLRHESISWDLPSPFFLTSYVKIYLLTLGDVEML